MAAHGRTGEEDDASPNFSRVEGTREVELETGSGEQQGDCRRRSVCLRGGRWEREVY